MSYQLGMDAICLRPAKRPGHTEYCSHDRLREWIRMQTGKSLEDAWECDLIWHTNDGPAAWSELGRTTDMGHAEFLEGGVDKRASRPCPFISVDEALAFDAVEEYGLPDAQALSAHYDRIWQEGQRAHPEQVFTGGYYKTMVSGAIETFGWDILLQAAADQPAFERVMDSFFRLSLAHYQAWARTRAEVFICHDDMVWSQGPFMDPAFYRRVIFPRYAALWRVLHNAGKKVLFCSDGDWTLFLDDIAAAGADGFIFEPMMSVETVVARYGGDRVIIGSAVDCRTLTYGAADAIRAEVDATLALARGCPGFFVAVGNHIPSNVPLENALLYFDCLSAAWRNSVTDCRYES